MPHIRAMPSDAPRSIARSHRRSWAARACMFWGGLLLVILSPLVGILPGPGGVFVFAAGFALMLRGSTWVKKKYARFKKRHPKKGDWVDFGLRRPSYRRRTAIARGLPPPQETEKARRHWTAPGEMDRRRWRFRDLGRRSPKPGGRPSERPDR